MFATSIGIGLVVAAFAGLAGTATGATLTGPSAVTGGKSATFVASGFPPGAPLEAYVSPTLSRGGNCCGDRVPGSLAADETGRVRFLFRWPQRYTFCAGRSCSRYQWKPRERADVSVVTVPTEADPAVVTALRVVRVMKPPAARTSHALQWRTPSKNIACAFRGRELTCEIFESKAPPPPRPADCDLDWGNRFSMTATGSAKGVCFGGVLASRPTTLPYGSTWSRAGLRCTVKRSGVRCFNRAQHGWSLARERVALF